jgi:hypothetical protein
MMMPAYDLEIMLPIEDPQRVIDFKKLGFWNIGNVKILLKFIVDDPKRYSDIIDSSMPEHQFVVTPLKHVAQKIAHYYSTLTELNARWFVRLDDDSLTNVKPMVELMDKLYDWEIPCHVMANPNVEVEYTEFEILKALGADYLYRHRCGQIIQAPPHEIEISCTSRAGMERILGTKLNKSYFKIRKEFANGFGDHMLCIAACIARMGVTESAFMTSDPNLVRWSMYGGPYHHIHGIARDKDGAMFEQFFDKLGKKEEYSDFRQKLCATTGLLKRPYDENNVQVVKFHVCGSVSLLDGEIIGVWDISNEGKTLLVIEDCGIFELREEGYQFRGDRDDLTLKFLWQEVQEKCDQE